MARIKPKLGDKLNYLFGDAPFPTRINTFRSLLGGRRGQVRPVRPWLLQVEVTNRCNINCVFCSRHENDLYQGDLDPALYDKIVSLSEKAQEVAMFGYGEPLMSRAFYDLLPKLRSSRIGFFTNGMLLNARLLDKVLALTKRPLSYIVFSIDGGTDKTYEHIRCRASFDRVIANLADVAKRRKELGLEFTLRIEFIAMKDNIRELPILLDIADKAGVDYIKVSHLVVWDEALRDQSLFYHQDLCREGFAAALEAAASRRIGLELPKPFGLPQPPAPPPCRLPWYYAMVSFEGDVRACCFAPELTMGSLKDSGFDEIWISSRYRELRRSLNGGMGPACCHTCEERYRMVVSPDDEATYIKLKPRAK